MREIRQMMADAQGKDPRLALAAVRELVDETDWLPVRAVRLARHDEYDWGRISRLLGVSRQAARCGSGTPSSWPKIQLTRAVGGSSSPDTQCSGERPLGAAKPMLSKG